MIDETNQEDVYDSIGPFMELGKFFRNWGHGTWANPDGTQRGVGGSTMIRTAKNTEVGDWLIEKNGSTIWECKRKQDWSDNHYRIVLSGEIIPAGTKLKLVRPLSCDHMDDVLASLDFKILNSSPYMYAIVELPKGESEVDRRIKAAQKELDAALEARKAEHE